MNIRFPVLTVTLGAVAFFSVYAWVTTPPPTPQQVAAKAAWVAENERNAAEWQRRATRFDELTAKDKAHSDAMDHELLGPDPFNNQNMPPPLTWEECMYIWTYNGGRLDGEKYIGHDHCNPIGHSEPDPVPVYIVPR
jgi:hypothetical protein